jgi:hypothetical protein
MEDLPIRLGGTFVVVTRDHCWGRGPTLKDACKKARSVGARSFAKRNVSVIWQPDEAWKQVREMWLAEHRKRDDEKAIAETLKRDMLPDVDPITGGVRGWGGRFERLHKPEE